MESGFVLPCYSGGWKKLSKNCIERLHWWLSGKESASQCRRHGFDPWSRTVPRVVEQLSLRTTGIEPVLWRLEAAAAQACVPSSLCPTRAATAVRSPGTTAGEEPSPAATREELLQQQRPRTARDKEIKKGRNRSLIATSISSLIAHQVVRTFFPPFFLFRNSTIGNL